MQKRELEQKWTYAKESARIDPPSIQPGSLSTPFDISDPGIISRELQYSRTAPPSDDIMQSIRRLEDFVSDTMGEVAMMRADIRSLVDKVDNLTRDTDFEEYDVREMPKDEIKKLILEEMGGGNPFYPSDVAQDHNLHYDAVMEAVEELRKEGRITE